MQNKEKMWTEHEIIMIQYKKSPEMKQQSRLATEYSQ